MSDIVRKNINMSKALASYYEEKAKELGVSQSALMVIALSEYMKQAQAMQKDMLDYLKVLLEQNANIGK